MLIIEIACRSTLKILKIRMIKYQIMPAAIWIMRKTMKITRIVVRSNPKWARDYWIQMNCLMIQILTVNFLGIIGSNRNNKTWTIIISTANMRAIIVKTILIQPEENIKTSYNLINISMKMIMKKRKKKQIENTVMIILIISDQVEILKYGHPWMPRKIKNQGDSFCLRY